MNQALKETVKFYRQYHRRHGFGPTGQEASAALGVSRQAISLRLRALVASGHLSQDKKLRYRAWKPKEEGK